MELLGMAKCRSDKQNERGIGIGTSRQSGGKRASLEEKIMSGLAGIFN